MRDFHLLFPNRFNNKTNGIAHRRWLLKANPGLSAIITEQQVKVAHLPFL